MRKIAITAFTFFLASASFAQDKKMDAFINDLMSKMTLEEKIGQLNLSNNRMYVTAATTGNHDGGEDMLKAGKMGAYYGFMNHDKIKELQQTAVTTGHKIPLIFGMDVIHGAETVYPIPLAMSTSWNMNLIEESARMAAKEATAIGVNWAGTRGQVPVPVSPTKRLKKECPIIIFMAKGLVNPKFSSIFAPANRKKMVP